MTKLINNARAAFQSHGGVLRTTEAIAAGIHPRILYEMRDTGQVEALARGVYRLAGEPELSNPDLATVAKRIPRGVVCLISALAFHELTTQVPHEVHIALPRTARSPRLSHPPLRVYRFSEDTIAAGVQAHVIDGVTVHIFSAEKTLADCFKYRNKIGMDVVLEALRTYRGKRPQFQRLLEYARICRVERQIRPYLEATI